MIYICMDNLKYLQILAYNNTTSNSVNFEGLANGNDVDQENNQEIEDVDDGSGAADNEAENEANIDRGASSKWEEYDSGLTEAIKNHYFSWKWQR